MARQWRHYWNLKSIVGVGLIGFGLFVLCGNLADVAARLSRIVGISAAASQTFGGVIAVGLVVSQVWRAYVFDRGELLLGVCGILISFWPLLLVIGGAVLAGTEPQVGRTMSKIKIQEMSIQLRFVRRVSREAGGQQVNADGEPGFRRSTRSGAGANLE